MSRGSYDDRDAKCPYYRARDGTSVTCEGYIESTYITIRCITNERRAQWTRMHCDDIRGWRNCPLNEGRDEEIELSDLGRWEEIARKMRG